MRRRLAFSRTYRFFKPHRAGVFSKGKPRGNLKVETFERNSTLDGDASETASSEGVPDTPSPRAQEAPRR